MATQLRGEPLMVEDFLDINFGDRKAELDNGYIRMMAGGTVAHARVQTNILSWLRQALRGSGCRPYGSDMGVRAHDLSLRYPDVSIFCGHSGGADDARRDLDDPKVVIEVLSPSTAAHDLGVKLAEYRALPAVDAIVFVDIEREQMRVLQRTGANAWSDTLLEPGADVPLPSLDLILPASEIFARD